MLEVEGLVAGYGSGNDVLHGVSLTVGDGEVVALVGLNGAGKSTLVRTINGMLRVRAGTVRFDGVDLTSAPTDVRARKGLMLVPEGRELCLPMTVRENLSLGTLALPREQRRRQAAEAEELVMSLFPILRERLKQVVGTMSGGQQQMVAIARALMGRPKLLILDEPSLGLAPQTVQQIFDVLAKLNQDGMSILLVEQKTALALSFSKRAYSLDLGRVKELSPAEAEERVRQLVVRAPAAGVSDQTRSASEILLPQYSGVHFHERVHGVR
jgi:branched-chain amino acid transport system ATP-binding protein